ncbi:MAG TPA: hypothetical protein VFV99_29670 [Kofleriaceae bacterium]|nr:hypothetical protein [Kofleriaceae bacterium]
MKLATLVAAAALVIGGCGNKKSKALPEVSGLAAVPASATAVVVADVARVIDAPLVERAVDQLLLRDPVLRDRWQGLYNNCKLDARKLKHVILAIGPHEPQAGTGPVIMVVTGQIAENELASCVRTIVGQGGGQLTAKEISGRTLYQAKDGNRTMFFAFGKPDTVILGSNEAYVTEALGTGKKVTDNAALVGWMKLADQSAPVWAAGQVDERVRPGLVKLTDGQVKEGPVAMVMSANPAKGLELSIGAVMASEADAKTLESFAKTQLGLVAMAAQAKKLGRVVDKVTISAEKQVVRFKAPLTDEDVNLIISALDGGGITAQDSPPATPGSASTAGAAGPQR